MTARHLDLANPEQHHCCFNVPIEPQAVPVQNFPRPPLAEAHLYQVGQGLAEPGVPKKEQQFCFREVIRTSNH